MLCKRHKGFTFVELLIAVLILSIAIGGVLLLYVTSMMSSQLAWDTTVATSHAESILEEAQTLESIDKIKNFNWKGWAEVQGLNTLPGENIDVAFSSPGNNLLGIQVTVNWATKARRQEVVLRTKLAK